MPHAGITPHRGLPASRYTPEALGTDTRGRMERKAPQPRDTPHRTAGTRTGLTRTAGSDPAPLGQAIQGTTTPPHPRTTSAPPDTAPSRTA